MVINQTDMTVERLQKPAKHVPSLLKHLYVERGTSDDWKALCDLHYKSHTVAAGPRYFRCVYDDGNERMLAGVMVLCNPRILDSGRNEVFPFLKPNQNGKDNKLINTNRTWFVNHYITWNNRTVLDTMFRGAGIAYRFKNLVYRMSERRYIESRSSMSRFNPFSEKAGMKFIKPKAAQALFDGIQFFAKILQSPAYDYVAVKEEILAMPEPLREKTIQKIREFYYKKSSQEKSGDKRDIGMSRVNGMELGNLIKQTQQVIFGATIYAVFVNPEFDVKNKKCRDLPARIPLLAFDLQAVDQPLNLEKLEQLK